MLNALMIVTIPSTPNDFICDFLNSNNSDIRLGECLRTLHQNNLLSAEARALFNLSPESSYGVSVSGLGPLL